ncbi:nitroreductase/quinone reductase family protein [Nocardia sp. NPDC004582]
MSANTMLLTFTGHRTGNRYAVVVRYVRQGDQLVCYTDSKWWINLRGNAAVEMLIAGHTVAGLATVVEGPAAVADSMSTFLHAVPGDSRYYGVRRDSSGRPDPLDIVAASERTKLIRIDTAANSVAE